MRASPPYRAQPGPSAGAATPISIPPVRHSYPFALRCLRESVRGLTTVFHCQNRGQAPTGTWGIFPGHRRILTPARVVTEAGVASIRGRRANSDCRRPRSAWRTLRGPSLRYEALSNSQTSWPAVPWPAPRSCCPWHRRRGYAPRVGSGRR